MPKVRDALLGVESDVAQRQRTCKGNSKHKIDKGNKCLVMRDSQSGYERSYCVNCAQAILKQAKQKIERLLQEVTHESI